MARKIQLIATYKQLGSYSFQRILHSDFVFRRPEYDTYGFVIAFGILFILEIIEVEIHLPNIFITDINNAIVLK